MTALLARLLPPGPLLSLLKRLWPLLLLGLIGGLLWWRLSAALAAAHDRGVAEEAARRDRAAAVARAVAAARQAQQSAAADHKAATAIDSRRATETSYVEKVRVLYRDRPDPSCVDADGMRLIRAADGSGAAAATAADGGADSVHEAAARRKP